MSIDEMIKWLDEYRHQCDQDTNYKLSEICILLVKLKEITN